MQKIVLTVGNVTIEADADNTDIAQEFISRLPLNLTMTRFADREYYVRIPALTKNGNALDDYENGDLTFYTKGPSFAIFFDKAGISSQPDLIRLGKITSDLSVFKNLGSEISIKIDVK